MRLLRIGRSTGLTLLVIGLSVFALILVFLAVIWLFGGIRDLVWHIQIPEGALLRPNAWIINRGEEGLFSRIIQIAIIVSAVGLFLMMIFGGTLYVSKLLFGPSGGESDSKKGKGGDGNEKLESRAYSGIARNVEWHERQVSQYSKGNVPGAYGGSTSNTATNYYVTEVSFQLEIDDEMGGIKGYLPVAFQIRTDFNLSVRWLSDGDTIEVSIKVDNKGNFSDLSVVNYSAQGHYLYRDDQKGGWWVGDELTDIDVCFSVEKIDYLRRKFLERARETLQSQSHDFSEPAPDSIILARVRSVALLHQYDSRHDDVRFSDMVAKALGGLCKLEAPLVFLVLGESTNLSLYIGTFHNESIQDSRFQAAQSWLNVVTSSLRSVYPDVELVLLDQDAVTKIEATLKGLSHSALIVGSPALTPDAEDAAPDQINRLVRGMRGAQWAFCVIGYPTSNDETTELTNRTFQELTDLTNTATRIKFEHPLGVQYANLLKSLAGKLDKGISHGLWHVQANLRASDAGTLTQVCAVADASFGGIESTLDPLRFVICNELSDQLARFSRLLVPAPEGPGQVTYPYQYLSLLNSEEFAALIHLPREEASGYRVRWSSSFDTDVPSVGAQAIHLGSVIDHGHVLDHQLGIDLVRLVRHVGVFGPTGSGKSTTTRHLLHQAWAMEVPFLVIEPAKAEYRKLLADAEMSKDLRIMTLGDLTTSPMRFNPFDLPEGIRVSTHIDLLTAAFTGWFVMYSPMQYVIGHSLREVYIDKGWSLNTSTNSRGAHPSAFPTMTDLYRKIPAVTIALGYEQRITDDVIAALQTRIDMLRKGGLGFMLDTRSSDSIDEILKQPTVIELDRIGNDEDKALVMGLLLMAIYERCINRNVGSSDKPEHLTVFEEAHRLLSQAPPMMDPEMASAKRLAVETFCNALSEVRAYGEGIVVVEQIPSKLAPDVVKNTAIKIAHGLVAKDDRDFVGNAMNLSEEQSQVMVSLRVGEAVVHMDGEDRPFLIKVTPQSVLKQQSTSSRAEDDSRVRQHMKSFGVDVQKLVAESNHRQQVTRIIDTVEFKENLARYILSFVTDGESLTREFIRLLQCISKLSLRGITRPEIAEYSLSLGSEEYFETMGGKYGWRFDETEKLRQGFLHLVGRIVFPRHNEGTLFTSPLTDEERFEIETYQKAYVQACQLASYPFRGCARVCSNRVCLYRHHLAEALQDSRLNTNFARAVVGSPDGAEWTNVVRVLSVASRRALFVSAPAEERRKAALCFAIQKAETTREYDYVHREQIVDAILTTYDSHNHPHDAKVTPSDSPPNAESKMTDNAEAQAARRSADGPRRKPRIKGGKEE